MEFTQESLIQAYTDLGWDMRYDDIHVEIGGTSVYEIDGAGTKWARVVHVNTCFFSSVKNILVISTLKCSFAVRILKGDSKSH